MSPSGDPAVHPLYLGVPLPYERTLPVFGVAVRFRSNDAAALATIVGWFAAWERYEGEQQGADDPVRVDVVIHDPAFPLGAEGEGYDSAPPAPLTVRIPDSERVISLRAGSVAIADARRRELLAYLTPSEGDAGEEWRAHVYGLLLGLLAHEDRFAIHAGGVARGDAAILLIGPSGTGKSTLAYAFAREGGSVLSDDSVFVQRRAPAGVWGLPGRLHLMVDTLRFFPELAEREAKPRPNGKSKIPVLAEDGAPSFVYRRFGLCILHRDSDPTTGGEEPTLTELSPDDVAREFLARPEERWDGMKDEAPAVHRSLAFRGAWRLDLRGAPQASVPHLAAMLDALGER